MILLIHQAFLLLVVLILALIRELLILLVNTPSLEALMPEVVRPLLFKIVVFQFTIFQLLLLLSGLEELVSQLIKFTIHLYPVNICTLWVVPMLARVPVQRSRVVNSKFTIFLIPILQQQLAG